MHKMPHNKDTHTYRHTSDHIRHHYLLYVTLTQSRLGQAKNGARTKLAHKTSRPMCKARAAVVKDVAPVVKGQPLRLARLPLGANKEHICQRPHMCHAEAANPVPFQGRVSQMSTPTPIDIAAVLPGQVNPRSGLKRRNEPLP